MLSLLQAEAIVGTDGPTAAVLSIFENSPRENFFFVLSLSGWTGTCGRDWCKEGTQETHPPATVAAVFMKS